jgi:hypothetical protein
LTFVTCDAHGNGNRSHSVTAKWALFDADLMTDTRSVDGERQLSTGVSQSIQRSASNATSMRRHDVSSGLDDIPVWADLGFDVRGTGRRPEREAGRGQRKRAGFDRVFALVRAGMGLPSMALGAVWVSKGRWRRILALAGSPGQLPVATDLSRSSTANSGRSQCTRSGREVTFGQVGCNATLGRARARWQRSFRAASSNAIARCSVA